MALSFRQIEVLHAVVATRSITGAARLLKVSQPSLSRMVRRLEDQLGVGLFERTRRGLVPTAAALRIGAMLEPIVGRLTSLDGEIARIARGEGAAFRLGATASVARALVPEALRALTLATPGLEFFFDVLATDQIEDYLVAGRGECVVTIPRPEHPLLASDHVGNGKLVAVLRCDHPLAARSVLSVQDVVGCDLIAFQTGGPHWRVAESYLSRSSAPRRTSCVVRFAETAIALADQGLGLALIDSFTVMGPLGDRLVVRPLDEAPVFEVHVHWNRERPRSQQAKHLIEGLSDRLSRHALEA